MILSGRINSDLLLEGVDSDRTLNSGFSASNESSDKPVFVSRKDFNTALTAYAAHDYEM